MSNTPDIQVNLDFSHDELWVASTKTFTYKLPHTIETLNGHTWEYLESVQHYLDTSALRLLRRLVLDQRNRIESGLLSSQGSSHNLAFVLEMENLWDKIDGWHDEVCKLRKELNGHARARRVLWVRRP
ncbi:MAG: hypothetical protein L6R38_006411 [Xanthoria sp. 2 TBL-2021]|nr:MAG: hypothetical protein L6R38_006411 [Xanthoria sp. 2 TBL-2021]